MRLPEPLPPLPHPSQAFTGCREDVLLRAHGYKIVARPVRGEAIWVSRDGEQVVASEALRRVRAELENICLGKR